MDNYSIQYINAQRDVKKGAEALAFISTAPVDKVLGSHLTAAKHPHFLQYSVLKHETRNMKQKLFLLEFLPAWPMASITCIPSRPLAVEACPRQSRRWLSDSAGNIVFDRWMATSYPWIPVGCTDAVIVMACFYIPAKCCLICVGPRVPGKLSELRRLRAAISNPKSFADRSKAFHWCFMFLFEVITQICSPMGFAKDASFSVPMYLRLRTKSLYHPILDE